MAEQSILKKQQWPNNAEQWLYFKEATIAEQCILMNNVFLKKQQSWTTMNNIFKETTMAEQCILKKQQWLNNVF